MGHLFQWSHFDDDSLLGGIVVIIVQLCGIGVGGKFDLNLNIVWSRTKAMVCTQRQSG